MLHHAVFEFGVHGGGGFIEQQNLGHGQEHAGQAHQLPLPARQTTPAFGNAQLQALGVVLNHLVQPRHGSGFEDLAVAGQGQTQRQVVAQRSVEQAHVLGQITHMLPHKFGGQVHHVHLVQVNLTRVGLVQAREQLDQGALA